MTVSTSNDNAPSIITAFDDRHAVIGTPSEGLGLSHSTATGKAYVSAASPSFAWKDFVLQGNSLSFVISGVTPEISALGNGNVGIGTTIPAQKLTVAGAIKSMSGGFVFPDGSIQNVAAAGGQIGPQGPVGPQGPEGPQGIQGTPVHREDRPVQKGTKGILGLKDHKVQRATKGIREPRGRKVSREQREQRERQGLRVRMGKRLGTVPALRLPRLV